MKSILWRCLIYSEIAIAVCLAVGIAQSYGRASVQPTSSKCVECLPTRTAPTTIFECSNMSTDSIVKDCGTLTGWATFYTRKSSGPTRADLKPMRDNALTCALPKTTAKAWNMKFGAKVRVKNLSDGRTVILTFADYGPAAWTGHSIDLTPAAMRSIAGDEGIRAGRVKVKVEAIY